jgi:hypothetical protein
MSRTGRWVWAAPDGWRLTTLTAVAVGIHLWLVAQTAVPARDGVVLARLAYRLDQSFRPPDGEGPRESPLDVVRSTEHPPGYPLAVCAVARVTGLGGGPSAPEGYLLAAQIANAVAGVLLVFPCYLIGRQLSGPDVGFAAALLFQVLPVPARVTGDALTEGLFLLAVATALAAAVRGVRTQRPVWYLVCGLATGASYLVRPEGLLVAAAPVAVTVGAILTRRLAVGPAAVRGALLAVGVAVVAGPYMGAIGRLTNKPTGVDLQQPLGIETARQPVHAGPLFAAWADPNQSGGERAAWGVKAVATEVGKGTHYGVGVLAAAAVLVLWRRYGRDPGWWVLGTTAVVSLTLLTYLAVRRGYISERHTVLLALVACQYAAAVLPVAAEWIARVLPAVGSRVTTAVLLTVLVLSAFPFAVKQPHRAREAHREAGRWLAAHTDPADRVIDPYTWAEWYAGRTFDRAGDWTADLPATTYVVLETGAANPESPLPQLEWARLIAERPGAEVVWHWPAAASLADAKLQVVRVPTRP